MTRKCPACNGTAQVPGYELGTYHPGEDAGYTYGDVIPGAMPEEYELYANQKAQFAMADCDECENGFIDDEQD